MSDIIHLLPDSVANQIAAGEVIQRPASVIKELVENAIDAGATRIDVAVEEAGKTVIQVVDNGKGMSPTDARLAFERHATSKISQATDLFALRTMGFRGEALASIAAVAQVELRTRQESAPVGTSIHIAGSQVLAQEPDSCPVGSNFQVKNLFYNVPARRKFLKSNQTELNNILQEFERVVLVNEQVAFSLTHNGTLMLSLPKASLRQRIVNVFGKKLNEQLLGVEVDTTLVQVRGFVGKPSAARKKGAHQYFFVNGRYMRHPYFHKAVAEAFAPLLAETDQVPYFLYLDVEPSSIDVNIHPTKTEIKFENEQAIRQILLAAVKETLGKFNAVPAIDFDLEGTPQIPAMPANLAAADITGMPTPSYNTDYNPFKTRGGTHRQRPDSAWQQLYTPTGGDVPASPSQDFVLPSDDTPRQADTFDDDPRGFSPAAQDFVPPSQDFAPTSQDFAPTSQDFASPSYDMLTPDKSDAHYQYKNKYVLTAVKSGLMIIDQHRAHVRVLYDRLIRQIAQGTGASQRLLFPEMVQVSPAQSVLLEHLTDDLQAMGFDIANLGGGSFSVTAMPSELADADAGDTIQDILAEALEHEKVPVADARHAMALAVARRSSIPYGRQLTNMEMQGLVDDLFACKNPNQAPDGKIIVAILEQTDLDRLFG